MTRQHAARSVLFPPFDTCPGCRATGLRAQAAGDQAIFSCQACHSYWHADLGWIHRVDPATCPSHPHATPRPTSPAGPEEPAQTAAAGG
jgi:hypothetical protein